MEWTTGDDPAVGAKQATAGTDYTAQSTAQTVMIAAGATSATIEVQTTQDELDEDDETFVVKLASPTNATLGNPNTGTGTITDDDAVTKTDGKVERKGQGDPEGPLQVAEDVETAPTFTITVTPQGATFATAQVVTVEVGKSGDTAVSGTDYTAVDNLTLILTAGSSSVTGEFTLDPTDDTLDEPDETLTVTSKIGGTVVSETTITITDDDDPPSVSVSNAADVSEGDDPSATTDMSFTVTLSAASGKKVTVPYALGGTATAGADYNRPNTLAIEIPAGDSSGSIVIPINGDTVAEGDETVTVALNQPVNATLSTVAGDTTATGVITDDDNADLTLVSFASTHYTATEGPTRRSVNVEISAAPKPGANLSVAYTIGGTATNGTDYAQISSPVTMSTTGRATIAIAVTDDLIDDAGETIILALVDGTGYDLGATHTTTITIIDDDSSDPNANGLPTVDIEAVYAVAEPHRGQGPSWAKFTVTLSEPLAQDVWIPIDLELISAEAEECEYSYNAVHCAPEVMPGRSLIGPQYEGITVSDCSPEALPRQSIMCLTRPYTETDAVSDWWEKVRAGHFVHYQRPYLLSIMAGETKVSAGFDIRRDAGSLSESFKILLAVDTPEWPKDQVQPGYSTEAKVIVVDRDLRSTTGNWWDELSEEGRRNLLEMDGVALAPRASGQSQWVEKAVSASSLRGVHPDIATVLGGWAGELMDAEMDEDSKRVDLSSVEAWWGDLDCRLRRVAVGDGATEDPDSRWCREWPDDEHSNDPAQLPSDLVGIATTIFDGLLAEDAVGQVDDLPSQRQSSEAPGPEVNILPGSHVTEGDPVTFMISAYPAPLADLDVSISITQTGDYGVTTGSHTITVSTTGTAFLDLLTDDDTVDEADGSVTGTINTGSGYTVSSDNAAATVKVSDNDVCTPQLPSDAVTVAEVTGWRDAFPGDTARVLRWNRVLEAMGEDTGIGAAAITIAEAQAYISVWGARWDRVTRTLQALAQCDNSPATTPEVSITGGSAVTEGGDATFTLTANPAPTADLDVSVTITQSGDYGVTAATQTVTIPTTGRATLTVATTGDSVDEADGSVTTTVNSGNGYTVSSGNGVATVSVSDDDVPEIGITAGPGVTEGGDATFTLTANPAPHATLSVSVSVSQSGDYGVTAATQTVTIPTTGSATLTVGTDDDSADEANGSVTATVNSGSGYTVGSPSAATVNVADNDVTQQDDDDDTSTSCLPADAVTVAEVTAWRDALHPVDAAPGVRRFNRVLEKLGVDTGIDESPMSHLEAQSVYDRLQNTRWDRIARTLTAMWEDNCDTTPPPADPEVSISGGPAVTEGGNAVFTLTASPVPAANLDVTVSVTQSGDFTSGTGTKTVTIPSSGNATLTVGTTNDNVDEADGSVTATVNSGSSYTVGSAGTATIDVEDDDVPAPATHVVSIAGGSSITEGGNAVFTLTASPVPAANLDVTVSVTQSGDFTSGTGTQTVTIPTTGSATLTVSTSGDSVDEADGSVTATVNSGNGYTVSSGHGAATVAVSDDDVPEIGITAGPGVTEGGDATFTVTANPAPHAALSVSVSVTQSGDYGVTTGSRTVTIPSGGSTTLTVSTSGDSVDEVDGSVTVSVNTGNGYTISSSKGSATVAVADDDPGQTCTPQLPSDAVTVAEVEGWRDAFPENTERVKNWNRVLSAMDVSTGETPMTIAESQANEAIFGSRWDRVTRTLQALAQCDDGTPATPEVSVTAGSGIIEGGHATFTVTASPAPASALAVTVTVSASGDYGVTTGSQTVTIPTTGSATLTVATTGDSVDEADGSVTVTVNSGNGYTVSSGNGSATVAVSDDDVPEISITAGSAITEGGDATFTVTANPSPHATLSVSVSVSQSGDYGAATGSQTVTISTSGSVVLTVGTTNDNADEASGSVTATVKSGNGYTVSSGNGSATVAVSDDDEPPPPPDVTISIADASGLEGDEVRFEVTLSEAVDHEVKVRWESEHAYDRNDFAVDTQEFWLMSGWLTFAPGETSQDSAVFLNQDNNPESDEVFRVRLSNPKGATIADGVAIMTIIDDD